MPASRQSVLVVAHCLLVVLAAACRAEAQSSSPPHYGSSAQVVEFGDQRPQSPRRIAIVGDVERPGVYESSSRRVLAGSALQAAGSLAAAGDYFWRYHAGLHPVATPTWNCDSIDLLSGDVIVVAISPQRRKLQTYDQIHVAVIGLGSDPVVIRMPGSDRTLAGLFSRLNQSSSAAAGASVNGFKSTEPLKNGDVIVVGSYLIDRAALKNCDAILPVQSLDAVPAASNPVTEASPPVDVQAAIELPPLEAPPISALAEAAQPVESSAPPRSDSDLQRASASETRVLNPVETRTAIDGSAEQRTPRVAALRAASHSRAAARSIERTDAADAEGTSNIRALVILLALGTMGLGVALLWLASERRLRTSAAPGPVAMTPIPAPLPDPVEDELDQLIRGRLPIEDEPVVLPARLALHGQAVGQKRLIVHPAQGLAGPHFGSPATSAGKAATHEATAAVSAQAAPGQTGAPIRSARDTEGLLDRVLLAMQREGRR